MKIVHLIDYFQPKLGYQEEYLAKEHQQLGHEVTIITSDRYFPFPAYENTYRKTLGDRIVGTGVFYDNQIKIIRLQSVELPGANVILLRGLKGVLTDINPEVVICHGVYSHLSRSAAILKKYFTYKLIYDTHAAPFNTNFSQSLGTKFFRIIHKNFIAPTIKAEADKIFAIGKEEQEFICDDFSLEKKNVPIIRLGVDTELFHPDSNFGLKIRKTFGWEKHDVVCTYAGKINHNKDVHILVDVLCAMQDTRLKFLLIGNGETQYVSSIINKLEKNGIDYRHISFSPRSKLAGLYQASNFGIWPGNPSSTFLEALSCGVLLILPKMQETEYLNKSKAVTWFKRGDKNSLSKAIKKILVNCNRAGGPSQSAINYCKSDLSWKIIAKQVLELCN